MQRSSNLRLTIPRVWATRVRCSWTLLRGGAGRGGGARMLALTQTWRFICNHALVATTSHRTKSRHGLLASWPNPSVPTFGAGVYTIWHNDGRFIYVGMSGRGITAGRQSTGIRPRHLLCTAPKRASGRRSGDQFCLYVADRLVLPTLSRQDIAAIASGRQMHCSRYIHEKCSRFRDPRQPPSHTTAYARDPQTAR
jgi:hypothetical protein